MSDITSKAQSQKFASALGPIILQLVFFGVRSEKKVQQKFLMFFKAFKFPSAHLRYQSAHVQIHDLDLVGHTKKQRRISTTKRGAIITGTFMISSCVAPPHCAGRLPRSSRLPFFIIATSSFSNKCFFCSCLGIAGALEFAVFYFLCPRFESFARAFFIILHMADYTTGIRSLFVKPEFNGW